MENNTNNFDQNLGYVEHSGILCGPLPSMLFEVRVYHLMHHLTIFYVSHRPFDELDYKEAQLYTGQCL